VSKSGRQHLIFREGRPICRSCASVSPDPKNRHLSSVKKLFFIARAWKIDVFHLILQGFLIGVLTGISAPYKNQNRQNSF
jgi:hypothetical protein